MFIIASILSGVIKSIFGHLPDRAFLHWIHRRSNRTIERPGEWLKVAQCHIDAVLVPSMNILTNKVFLVLFTQRFFAKVLEGIVTRLAGRCDTFK